MTSALPLIPPGRLGALLAERRLDRGQTLEEIADQAARLRLDISRNELWSVEHGLISVDDSKLAAILALYQLQSGGRFVGRARLVVDLDDGLIWAGLHQAPLGPDRSMDHVLRRYVALLHVLRNEPPGHRLPLRIGDIEVLAAAFDADQDKVEHQVLAVMDDKLSTQSYQRLQSRVRVPAAGLLVGITRVGALVMSSQDTADGESTPAAPAGPAFVAVTPQAS